MYVRLKKKKLIKVLSTDVYLSDGLVNVFFKIKLEKITLESLHLSFSNLLTSF